MNEEEQQDQTTEEEVPELAPLEPVEEEEEKPKRQPIPEAVPVEEAPAQETPTEPAQPASGEEKQPAPAPEPEQPAPAPEPEQPAPAPETPATTPEQPAEQPAPHPKANVQQDPDGPPQTETEDLDDDDLGFDIDEIEADEDDSTCCPSCGKDYVAEEKFCTNCGCRAARSQTCVHAKEEIVSVAAETKASPTKAPALEWYDDDDDEEEEEEEEVEYRFEIACYNCQAIFEVTINKAPAIIPCTTCATELQVDAIPETAEVLQDVFKEMEVKPRRHPTIKPPKKGCPYCGGKTRFIPRHFKWFCDTCKRFV